MSFQTIRQAQQRAWPRVRESLGIRKAQREAVHADPATATAAATARARIPWNRVVADETVWALAKEDLLNTPEDAEVIKAARAWAASWPNGQPPTSDTDEPEDTALYAAVQALGASLRTIDDKVLTDTDIARNVSTNKNND
jgi:hypothetical protein